jgi:hypothetical protein
VATTPPALIQGKETIMAKWIKMTPNGVEMWVWRCFALAKTPGACPKEKRFQLWTHFREKPYLRKIETFASLTEGKQCSELAYIALMAKEGDTSLYDRSEAIKRGLRRAEEERQQALRILDGMANTNQKELQ